MTTDLLTSCKGCGTSIPSRSSTGRRLRIWCGEACRVATYRGGHRPAAPAVLERPATCSGCGQAFTAARASHHDWWRRTCSDACASRASSEAASRPKVVRALPCRSCGTTVVTAGSRASCKACAAARMRAAWRRKNAARRGAGRVGPLMTIEQLGERDGWKCHLCRRKVNPQVRAPHRRSATFDHLIPVSDGGDDSPRNLRLAHWSCNSSRGAGGVVQLLLVGWGGRGMAGMGPPPLKHPSQRRGGASQAGSLTRLPAGRTGEPPAWPLIPDVVLTTRHELTSAKVEKLQEDAREAEREGKPLGLIERRLDKALEQEAIIAAQLGAQRGLEAELWRDLWALPQAVQWERLGWTRDVAQYVRHKVMAELGELDQAVEARQWSDRLGLSPLALLRLRWEVVADEVAEARSANTPTSRRRLRAVEG